MKGLLSILTAAAILAIGTSSFADVASIFPNHKKVFVSTGTNGTTLSSVIISANAYNDGCPVVTYYNATSDKAGSKLQFYLCDTNQQANYASSSTSIPVTATNGFASGDIIIIRHYATDTYERRVLTTFTSATNLTVTLAPVTALAVGDQVYHTTTVGAPWIACGNATVTSSGNSLVAGQPGCPLLCDLDGTSACSINALTAEYKLPAK